MAQQHAAELQVLRGDLRDLRADHGARLDRLEDRHDRLDARQFEMAQSLARIAARSELAAVASRQLASGTLAPDPCGDLGDPPE